MFGKKRKKKYLFQEDIPNDLEKWRSQFPSVTLTREVKGDKEYAGRFRGESDILMGQLKNQMKFNNLGQLKMTRMFKDGTIVTAWSRFGQDFISIDVTQVVEEEDQVSAGVMECTITFINIPDVIPPMKYYPDDAIQLGEVQGVDYLKTYYIVDVTECGDCQEIEWSFLTTYSDPVEPRHFFNELTQMDEPDNHSVYSLAPPVWAQILGHGTDSGGTYIIWKAYTESSTTPSDYSRTGLGIPLIRAIIKDSSDTEICRQQHKFDVDCCKKDESLRPVQIWWENSGTCQPYITYQGTVYNSICKIPTTISMSELIYYACMAPQQPFYAIPEILGSCLPVEWTLSGPIELWYGSKKNDHKISIRCLENNCYSAATIKLSDRCGTEYVLETVPCCGSETPLLIGYTSLAMSCGQQQTLSASGGCDPYTWNMSGGGSLSSYDTPDTVYTAPDTNENCELNPTITVTDCCGSSASVQLAVNCWSGDDAAIGNAEIVCCTQTFAGFPPDYLVYRDVLVQRWRCDGTLLYTCETNPGCVNASICPYPCTLRCEDLAGYCYTAQCGGACGTSGTCGQSDCRTAAMKTGGCCPLNPATGLPY